LAVIDPLHLLDQATRLIQAAPTGAPRQADLRRAISATYYAVFHCASTALADEFVGRTKRSEARYALVYRSINHRALKDLCADIVKPTLPGRLLAYEPSNGFGRNLVEFAAAVVDLQAKRHAADYDCLQRFRTSDAMLAIATAKRANSRFSRASAERRAVFLTLLVTSIRAS
jgi:hypothetical protein